MKKLIYVILSCVLGILSGYTIYGLIEFFYLNYSISNGEPVVCTGLTPTIGGGLEYPATCINLIYLQYGLMILGVMAGFYFGQKWYKQVYEQKRGGFIIQFSSRKKGKKKK